MSGTVQPVRSASPVIRVRVEDAGGPKEYRFETSFRIGRAEDCEVRIVDDYVSRAHVEIVYERGNWVLNDLGSSNGTFVDGQRIQVLNLHRTTTVRLGSYGPLVTFTVETEPVQKAGAPAVPGETMIARYVDHYFGSGDPNAPVGEHTMMVRRAFERVQKKQKRRYYWVLGGLALALVAIGAYAYNLHVETQRRKDVARELFYSMKSLDIDIANLERLVATSTDPKAQAEVRNYQQRRGQMEQNYDRFLTSLKVYDPHMTQQQRLILRIARIFGECELAMPPEFATEIETYIGKWKSSGRYARGIRTAVENGYNVKIAAQMLAHDLPPQFFYLALQESDFDPFISGPPTRKGIAKGMWQFIPETALKYQLKLGPLVDLRRPDPADDRHHWQTETNAAARYLKDLYSSDAQASGLLVMACYNWGEDSVLPLVRQMPANPRERNFWKLLSSYRNRIPKETYDYVFYIASAAVIGENPRLFGFDFDNPLSHLESK